MPDDLQGVTILAWGAQVWHTPMASPNNINTAVAAACQHLPSPPAVFRALSRPCVVVAVRESVHGESQVPDCLASIAMAKKGLGPGAVANAIGSQIINIFIGASFCLCMPHVDWWMR
jgi:Ca2+/Na+ antiporter